MARGINPLVPIVGAALLSACAHAIPLQATLERPPTVRQVPLAVGVFYSQEFRDYMHSNWRGGDRWDFPLGQASVKLFGQALPILFESVVPVSGRSPLPEGGAKLAAVIEPKIEAFDFSLPFLKTGTYTAEISYRVTLHSPEGLALASWTVKGIGAKPGQAGFEFARWPGEAADLAMQDAANKLLTSFWEVPEVRHWLRQAGVRGANWMPGWLRTFFRRG
ncbi:MAG: hypothetical protein XU13_C0156G0001 [Candidatus Rokubacteria bacterium CSP1-6]|nr:MAG: hypothetical protein XU13_C0156G0001 [Candidatus Rokubacteria bacterium CSP1-6]